MVFPFSIRDFFFLFRFVFALSLGRKFIRLGHRAGETETAGDSSDSQLSPPGGLSGSGQGRGERRIL